MSELTNSQPDVLTDDPFEESVPEEQVELRALEQALRLGAQSHEFHLLFARCNIELYQQALIRRMQSELPSLKIHHIHFNEKIDHLLDQLRWRLEGSTPDAVFVTGLEHSYSASTERPRQSPLILNLNASRNSFARYVPCPLVIWLPESMLTALFHGAPDFFSIRSGVYSFIAAAETTAEVAESLTAEDGLTTDNLTEAEKQNRIAAIRSLLADYEAQPETKRVQKAEMDLLNQLASLQESMGQAEATIQSYERALAISREIGDRRGEGADLGNLGNAYASLGEVRRAIEHYEQALAISREIEDKSRESSLLTNLGDAWWELDDAQQALAYYLQALTLDREQGNQRYEAIDLGQIGEVYFEQGETEEAIEYFELALASARRITDREVEAEQLWNLSRAWEVAGERSKAIDLAEQALILSDPQDSEFAATILTKLAEWRE
ncbi:MAG TPA: tetratricopeptide repeat protein [Blastocatellia bacterium]|nr:tetratricopeptide repeat protein [Blastocatellia bacterium]